MNLYEKYYKEINLVEDDFIHKLNKVTLYALIRRNIQNTDINDTIIDNLYSFWQNLNEDMFKGEYSIFDFADYLEKITEEKNIQIEQIDLNECLKDFYDKTIDGWY